MGGIYLPVILLIASNLVGENANNEDFYAMIFTIIVMALTFLYIFKMNSVVEISADGLGFKEFPFSRNLRFIPIEEVASLIIADHKWWHGYGYRNSFSGGGRIYAMTPGKVLKLVTKSGKKYQFGINRRKLVKRFIEEEWPNTPFHVE
mgnify:FL=1